MALGIEDQVDFLGAVPQARLPDLYRRAAVFVAPFVQARSGDQEGLGLVSLEAIGCGCPVIVSDLPAVRDLVIDPAMRVPPGNVAELARAICRGLDAAPDEGTRQAEELRNKVVDRFDWEQRAKVCAAILAELSMGSQPAA